MKALPDKPERWTSLQRWKVAQLAPEDLRWDKETAFKVACPPRAAAALLLGDAGPGKPACAAHGQLRMPLVPASFC